MGEAERKREKKRMEREKRLEAAKQARQMAIEDEKDSAGSEEKDKKELTDVANMHERPDEELYFLSDSPKAKFGPKGVTLTEKVSRISVKGLIPFSGVVEERYNSGAVRGLILLEILYRSLKVFCGPIYAPCPG